MLPKLVNLSLIGLFPLAWTAPLARAEVLWFWDADEVTILSGIQRLYEKDIFLCVVVALFAVVAPYVKTLTLAYAHFSSVEAAAKVMPAVEIMGRLSMVDVFLVAFYVVLYRGFADVQVAWGLYLFTGLVIASLWAAWATRRERFIYVPRPAQGE
ncbi:MAG: paraquat-inducible protein A [Pseudomonadota bacterium]